MFIKNGKQADRNIGKLAYWDSGPTEKQPYDHRGSGVIIGVQGRNSDALIWFAGDQDAHHISQLKNLRIPR